MDLKIPPQFKEVLEQNTTLMGVVGLAIGELSPWLARNNIKFFIEYTDHSLQHIEDVLAEANDLIREQCRGMVTPADVATLVLATLLHDCAMHLSIDSFIELVHSDNRPLIEGFGDQPWKSLWNDFLAEARKFSGRKLMSLFGNTDPVEYPPLDPQQITGRDLLLIGEFLRRHHHRLAHEIALWGVPGPENEKLKLLVTDDTKYVIDLSGVIARSHGMNIRDCIQYLKSNYGSEKQFKGTHTVFMMALLRISDILQIQSGRAPKQVEKVQKLQSPISLGEWDMHQAIEEVQKYHEDPETIMVIAHPTNVRTYLRIRKMLDQIQNELDQSWTVIGEVYSYYPQFREIGLKFRRIRSNIDDLKTFTKQVNYIPTQVSFDIADSDLLKLLFSLTKVA
jgi:molecular chaperone HtpG